MILTWSKGGFTLGWFVKYPLLTCGLFEHPFRRPFYLKAQARRAMEADAKHDFQASAADELPFCKNSVLKVSYTVLWYASMLHSRIVLASFHAYRLYCAVYLSFPTGFFRMSMFKYIFDRCYPETWPNSSVTNVNVSRCYGNPDGHTSKSSSQNPVAYVSFCFIQALVFAALLMNCSSDLRKEVHYCFTFCESLLAFG